MRFRGHLARLLVRPAVLVLACSAVFAATASAHISAPRHVGRCNAHLSNKLKATSKVLVWEKEAGDEGDSGGVLFTLYACVRPAGGSVAIGKQEEDGPEYIGNVETTNLSISGTLLGDLITTGLTEEQTCGKYDACNGTSSISEVARVYNLATGRSIRQPLAAAAIAYAFTPLGAIAWEAPTSPGTTGSPTVLQAVSFDPSNLQKGPVETLDTGTLGSALHFTGLTLAWTNAGQPKSQTITSG